MVKEELEAPEHRLRTPSGESGEVGGTQEPVAIDGAEDVEISRHERHAADRGALEAGPAGLKVRHRESA
jgi:hypothetical protein